MRWSPFRISEPWAKLLYIVVWVAVGVTLLLTLRPPGIGEILVILLVATVAGLIGVRSFRGAGEPLIPTRIWWRATTRPTAGFVLAVLLGLNALQYLVLVVFQTIAVIESVEEIGFLWGLLRSVLVFLWSAGVGIFYLNSSRRLRREPRDRRWVTRERSPSF